MTDQVRGDVILGCSSGDNRALNEELVFAVEIWWGCALSLHSNYLQKKGAEQKKNVNH